MRTTKEKEMIRKNYERKIEKMKKEIVRQENRRDNPCSEDERTTAIYCIQCIKGDIQNKIESMNYFCK